MLVFVGLKMVWLDTWYGGKFPIGISLGIIASVITISIVASLLFPRAAVEAPVTSAVPKEGHAPRH